MSVVVLLLLIALNGLALFFGWHGRRLDDQLAACELECHRLEAQNVALSRALAVAEVTHPPPPRPAPGGQE